MNRLRDSGIYEKLARDSGSRPPLPHPVRAVVIGLKGREGREGREGGEGGRVKGAMSRGFR